MFKEQAVALVKTLCFYGLLYQEPTHRTNAARVVKYGICSEFFFKLVEKVVLNTIPLYHILT